MLNCVQCVCRFFFKTMYNKTIIRFGFCNNLKLSRSRYVLSASAFSSVDNTYSTLIVPDVTTTEPNNRLLSRLSFYFKGATLWQRRCSYVDESLCCVTRDNRCFRDGYKPRVQPIVVPVDRSFVALFLVELTSVDWLHWRLSSPTYKNLHWAWRIQSSSEILHGQLG